MTGRKRKRDTVVETADELKETVNTLNQRMQELETYVKELTSNYLEYVLQENRLRKIDDAVTRLHDRVCILASAQTTTTNTIDLVWQAHQRLRYDYDMHIVPTEPTTPNTPSTPNYNAQISTGPILLTSNEHISDLFD